LQKVALVFIPLPQLWQILILVCVVVVGVASFTTICTPQYLQKVAVSLISFLQLGQDFPDITLEVTFGEMFSCCLLSIIETGTKTGFVEGGGCTGCTCCFSTGGLGDNLTEKRQPQ
jgi:hypothetical protein